MILVLIARSASAEEPVCVPISDDDLREVAARVRSEAPETEAHDAMIRDLLSRLTCSDPALGEDPWVQLLLAEAHVHHAAALAGGGEPVPVAMALPVVFPVADAGGVGPEPEAAAEPRARAEAVPLEAGPPDPRDQGGTARIKVRSPVPVRLEGWTGTFRSGVVPTGTYVVTPRFPPDFDPVRVLTIDAAPDDVWSVRCTRSGVCEALRLSGRAPEGAATPPPAPPSSVNSSGGPTPGDSSATASPADSSGGPTPEAPSGGPTPEAPSGDPTPPVGEGEAK